MERLRTPFFVVAFVAALLIVVVELGATHLFAGHVDPAQFAQQSGDLGLSMPAGGQVDQPPGLAINYLALIDIIGVFTVGLMGLGMIIPDRVQGRLQGVVTLVAAIVLILVSLLLLVIAIVKLILMVTLLLAFPFGTIAYLIIWGFFPRGSATVILSLLMFLKLVFAGGLVAAQQRFLQNKGLVALILTLLLANVIAAFLQEFVPIILVSITDAVAAIVFAVVAIIWGIVLLIGSIPAIVNAVRATAAEAADAAIPG